MNYCASPCERSAESRVEEELWFGWQMCCAAGTQVQAGLMSKRRPCGLKVPHLLQSHLWWVHFGVSSASFTTLQDRTDPKPDHMESRAGWCESLGSDLLETDHWRAGLTCAYWGANADVRLAEGMSRMEYLQLPQELDKQPQCLSQLEVKHCIGGWITWFIMNGFVCDSSENCRLLSGNPARRGFFLFKPWPLQN